MKTKSWLLAFLTLGCFLACITQSSTAQAQEQPLSVVSSYLSAWRHGDYTTMYGLWDAKSRQSVTLDQLHHVLTVDIKGDSQDDVKRRQLLGGASQILRSRIAAVVSVKVHPETSDYATADYVVQTTFQSLKGIQFVLLLPDLLKQAKADDTQTKHSDSSLAVVAAALGADKPALVSTTNNNYEAITHGQDVQDKQGPYITLYLHQFILVKEQGQWRIANAVTVSDQPPT